MMTQERIIKDGTGKAPRFGEMIQVERAAEAADGLRRYRPYWVRYRRGTFNQYHTDLYGCGLYDEEDDQKADEREFRLPDSIGTESEAADYMAAYCKARRLPVQDRSNHKRSGDDPLNPFLDMPMRAEAVIEEVLGHEIPHVWGGSDPKRRRITLIYVSEEEWRQILVRVLWEDIRRSAFASRKDMIDMAKRFDLVPVVVKRDDGRRDYVGLYEDSEVY